MLAGGLRDPTFDHVCSLHVCSLQDPIPKMMLIAISQTEDDARCGTYGWGWHLKALCLHMFNTWEHVGGWVGWAFESVVVAHVQHTWNIWVGWVGWVIKTLLLHTFNTRGI